MDGEERVSCSIVCSKYQTYDTGGHSSVVSLDLHADVRRYESAYTNSQALGGVQIGYVLIYSQCKAA
jgi:hypothetical protein